MQEQISSPSFLIENSFDEAIVAGIDEAGRGPLAGPVVAACVVLNRNNYPQKINDSKKLSAKNRRLIFTELKQNCADGNSAFGVGIVDAQTIDQINILQATKLAMRLAYEDMCNKHKLAPNVILVDGNFAPFDLRDQITQILPVIKGDQKSLSIAAASIIAKEIRDEIMRDLHEKFPYYGWDKNAAYPTKSHVEAIEKFGICQFHRKSFSPIKNMI